MFIAILFLAGQIDAAVNLEIVVGPFVMDGQIVGVSCRESKS
jgi:hypothetical protein